ncbi:MAG TPA: hypothetical protein VEB40_00950 [Flavipsychrobacter sp.]|nr:hypothetical protein [Flavipsychrobacter sp.]
MKKKFFKETKVGRAIVGFAKGAVQWFPAGNGLLCAIENVQALKKKIPLPHRWDAIVFEFIGCGVVLKAWHDGLLTTDQVINYLTALIEALPQ